MIKVVLRDSKCCAYNPDFKYIHDIVRVELLYGRRSSVMVK